MFDKTPHSDVDCHTTNEQLQYYQYPRYQLPSNPESKRRYFGYPHLSSRMLSIIKFKVFVENFKKNKQKLVRKLSKKCT